MRAAIYPRYGDAGIIEIREIGRPEIGDGQILVQVFATTVTTGDWRIRASAFPGLLWPVGRMVAGLLRPRSPVLGGEFAGRVVARGSDVTRFALGDAVFGFSMSGAHAEYVAIDADGPVAPKPARLGYGEAAAVPFGALSALVFLRDFAKIRAGAKVLVTGASGGVGVHAVQIAKHFGAEVTGLCGTDNVELVASLGADRVVDYRTQDIGDIGETFDLVLDTAGVLSFSRARHLLRPKGIFLPIEIGGREIVQAALGCFSRGRLFSGRRVVIGISGTTRADLEYVAGLLDSGDLRPVIDSRYPLAGIADAHRRVETRHKRGSVVVDVRAEGNAVSLAA